MFLDALQVDGVRAWLSDSNNNNSLSEKSLLVLINELTCKPIGISGNRLFTVTYSTFMTVRSNTFFPGYDITRPMK